MEPEVREHPLCVRSLRKSFDGQTVLNGIDLDVNTAETVALLGRSGTGKSVFLKLLIGLVQPDAGSIRIEGREITRMRNHELNQARKKVGFLFQQAALYDSLTVEENVAFPLERHAGLPEQARRERVRQLLASVGMDQALKKMPSQISGGMQKRVGLARALALDPHILLLDEPTAGLDPITAEEISQLILDLKKRSRITAVVVTHDLPSARVFADRLVLLHEGNIAAEGSFADLRRISDEFVVRFLREGAEWGVRP